MNDYENPDRVPVIAEGGHGENDQGAHCIMEYVSWKYGLNWSDHPVCTDPVIADAAITINDDAEYAERQLLAPLADRLFAAAPVEDWKTRARVYRHLARQVIERLEGTPYMDNLTFDQFGSRSVVQNLNLMRSPENLRSPLSAILDNYRLHQVDDLGNTGADTLADILDMYDKARAEHGVL